VVSRALGLPEEGTKRELLQRLLLCPLRDSQRLRDVARCLGVDERLSKELLVEGIREALEAQFVHHYGGKVRSTGCPGRTHRGWCADGWPPLTNTGSGRSYRSQSPSRNPSRTPCKPW
jgi:hypothetical protein